MIYVYKIINDNDVVEHVGMTTRSLEQRFKEHKYKFNPNIPGRGKFYQRDDVRIELISEWETRADARNAETYWQTFHWVRDGQVDSRKLTEDQVVYIRNSKKEMHDLAKEFDVHPNTIYNVVVRKTYKEVI